MKVWAVFRHADRLRIKIYAHVSWHHVIVLFIIFGYRSFVSAHPESVSPGFPFCYVMLCYVPSQGSSVWTCFLSQPSTQILQNLLSSPTMTHVSLFLSVSLLHSPFPCLIIMLTGVSCLVYCFQQSREPPAAPRPSTPRIFLSRLWWIWLLPLISK